MIRKIWGVARVEYMGFLTSKKVLFMLFAFIFLAEDVVGKMGKIAIEQGFPLGRLEPFILLFSYKIHVMLVPITFVVMLSDFPSNEKSGYFTMSRITRTAWLFAANRFVRRRIFLLSWCQRKRTTLIRSGD